MRRRHENTGVLDAVEIDVHRAAREAIRDGPRGLQRQARLADAPRAHQRDQSHVGVHQQLADLGQLAAAADRLVGGRGQHGPEPCATTFRRQRATSSATRSASRPHANSAASRSSIASSRNSSKRAISRCANSSRR